MGKVLIINDSRFEAIIMGDMVTHMGHSVKIIGEDRAVNQALEYDPDFVFVNYIMKDMTGDQLISILKIENPDIRCVLFSNNPIHLEDFPHKKIDAVFQTPVTKEHIRQALDETIRPHVYFTKIPDGVAELEVHKAQAQLRNRGDGIESCMSCGGKINRYQDVFCPQCGGLLAAMHAV